MDRSSWVFQLSPEEVARAIRIISGRRSSREARVARRGRGRRPWVIILNGSVQTDWMGRPRRFKSKRAALSRMAALQRII